MSDPAGQLEMEMEDEELAKAKAVKGIKPVKKVPVVEVFGPTIQGEGALFGARTSFIRFGLCDYKCTKCDSMHAVDPLQVKRNAIYMTPEEIVTALLKNMDPENTSTLNAPWVTFSGGNPCIHDLSELVKRIRGLDITHGNLKIAVETQGTFMPEWLHWCDNVTVSPKSPGMGEQYEHDKFLRFLMAFKNHQGFCVKVVVFSMLDIEWARTINDLMREEGLGDRMYLSLGNMYPPGIEMEENDEAAAAQIGVDNHLKLCLLESYRSLTEDLLQLPDMQNVKFLPQLHVLTWANKQGV